MAVSRQLAAEQTRSAMHERRAPKNQLLMDADQRHLNNVDDQHSARIWRVATTIAEDLQAPFIAPIVQDCRKEIRVGTSRNIVDEITSDEIASILKPACLEES